MARFEKVSKEFVVPRWPFPRSRKLCRAEKPRDRVLLISRTHRDRSAKRILWFNFPSVATRNSSVRDLRIRMAVGQTWNARNYTPSLYSLSLSLFVPTGEKCFTIKLCDRRLSNISRTRPPLKAPTIELGKTSWLNHRRVSVSPSTFASAIDLSRLSRENWGGPNVSRLFFPLNRQERNSGGCNSFYINREISIEF